MHVARKLTEMLGRTGYALILVCGAVAAAEDAASPEPPVTDAPAASADAQRPQHEGDEDILDRVFAPLDDAVDDINRNLNEKQGGAPAPSSD